MSDQNMPLGSSSSGTSDSQTMEILTSPVTEKAACISSGPPPPPQEKFSQQAPSDSAEYYTHSLDSVSNIRYLETDSGGLAAKALPHHHVIQSHSLRNLHAGPIPNSTMGTDSSSVFASASNLPQPQSSPSPPLLTNQISGFEQQQQQAFYSNGQMIYSQSYYDPHANSSHPHFTDSQLTASSLATTHLSAPSVLTTHLTSPSMAINQLSAPSMATNQFTAPSMANQFTAINTGATHLTAPTMMTNQLTAPSMATNQFTAANLGTTHLATSTLLANQFNAPNLAATHLTANQLTAPSMVTNQFNSSNVVTNQFTTPAMESALLPQANGVSFHAPSFSQRSRNSHTPDDMAMVNPEGVTKKDQLMEVTDPETAVHLLEIGDEKTLNKLNDNGSVEGKLDVLRVLIDKDKSLKKEEGVIAEIRPSFGFVSPKNSKERIFFLPSAVVGTLKFRSLKIGQPVSFAIVSTAKGPEARQVEILEDVEATQGSYDMASFASHPNHQLQQLQQQAQIQQAQIQQAQFQLQQYQSQMQQLQNSRVYQNMPQTFSQLQTSSHPQMHNMANSTVASQTSNVQTSSVSYVPTQPFVPQAQPNGNFQSSTYPNMQTGLAPNTAFQNFSTVAAQTSQIPIQTSAHPSQMQTHQSLHTFNSSQPMLHSATDAQFLGSGFHPSQNQPPFTFNM